MGPQGAGPCAQDKDIVSGSWSSKWTRLIGHGTLRSHEILGVMLNDLSIVQGKNKRKIADRRKISSFSQTEEEYRDITPSLMGVLPHTQASPSTLSSKRVLPSLSADRDGGVAWWGQVGRGWSVGGTYIGSACGMSPTRVSA